MKIYLIGSLGNRKIIELAKKIRDQGHDCFDDWIGPGEEADEKFNQYRKRRGLNYKEALASYAAQHIFHFDDKHLKEADIVVLVMPAGKSGHLELGVSIGRGKPGYILLDGEPERVDIMHSYATEIFLNEDELFAKLKSFSYSDKPSTVQKDWFDRTYKSPHDIPMPNYHNGRRIYPDPLPLNYQRNGCYLGNGQWVYYK